MKRILGNKKGFTLLEILVTVGIVGVLSAVAVPAYKQYKDNANAAALKADVSTGHKAYLAYETVYNSYCASLDGVGIKNIGTSPLYTGAQKAFAGFNSNTCNGGVTGDLKATWVAASGTTDAPAAKCTLDETEFVFGVAFEQSASVARGYYISESDSGPTETTRGSCNIAAGNSDETTCLGLTTPTAGVWTAASILDVCG